jgi:hypothetical protein
MAGGSNPDYRRLSIAGKQALHRNRMREPSVACPVCDAQTTAADLLKHIATRCPGPQEPGAGSRWVSWREALALGVPRSTMNKWVKRGRVRVRGELQARQYLLRDVAMRLAERWQRREFTKVNRPAAGGI